MKLTLKEAVVFRGNMTELSLITQTESRETYRQWYHCRDSKCKPPECNAKATARAVVLITETKNDKRIVTEESTFPNRWFGES